MTHICYLHCRTKPDKHDTMTIYVNIGDYDRMLDTVNIGEYDRTGDTVILIYYDNMLEYVNTG